MKEEIKIFLTGVMFFTRIPVRKMGAFKDDYLNKCVRYFPLIGMIVGALSFLTYWGSSVLFPTSIAVLLSFVVGILTTGAFHEDGLGDVFDGFGGGWTKTDILRIMKDSRIGTYGTFALVLMLLLKFLTLFHLVEILQGQLILIFLVFITYHALARTVGISLSFLLPYSREDATSKSKPIAKSHSAKEVVGALFFGLVPLVFLLNESLYFLWVIPGLVLLLTYSKYYFNKWIDGFTGDVLGAVEQMAEALILLSFLVIWKFI